MADLLIELGCEELPAAHIPGLVEDFSKKITEFLQQSRLGFVADNLTIYATPRRLAALCHDLAHAQDDVVVMREGPSFSKALTPEGQPTPAAIGFAKAWCRVRSVGCAS